MEIAIKEEKIDDTTISLENYYTKSGAIYYVKPNNEFSFCCTLCQKEKCANLENLQNHLEHCSMSALYTFNFSTNSETIKKSTGNEPDSLSNIELIKEEPNEDEVDNKIKCGEVYYSKSSKLVTLACTLCITETFTTFDEFSMHTLTHLQNDAFEEDDVDTESEKETQTDELSSLKKQTLQIREKIYKCEECLKFFTSRSHLKIHIRMHTGEKPYRCKECLKCFSTTSNLKIHRRIHTGEKPFKCEDCLKCFTTLRYQKIHMRIHTREKPFKCELCCKCFNHAWCLNRHMRIHTGEKPFKCKECLKCFTTSSNLKSHKHTNKYGVNFLSKI